MNQLLIGLAGLHHSLNAAVAEHLRDTHGLVIVRIAEPFEEAVAALMGKSTAYVRDIANAHLPALSTFAPSGGHHHFPTMATAVRDMRCEYAHLQHPDFIPHLLEQRLQELAGMHGEAAGFVVPDLLFSNEGDFIRSHSGTVVHLKSWSASARVSWGHYGTNPVQARDEDVTIRHSGTHGDVLDAIDRLVARLRSTQVEG